MVIRADQPSEKLITKGGRIFRDRFPFQIETMMIRADQPCEKLITKGGRIFRDRFHKCE